MKKACINQGVWTNFAYDELNLCEIPLVGNSAKKKRSKIICYHDTVRDASSGKSICRTFALRPCGRPLANQPWSPNWRDVDVLLALIKLKYEWDKFKSATLQVKLVDAWVALGGVDTKNRYRQIEGIRKSITRWSNLSITCDNWRFENKWKEVSFSPIRVHWEFSEKRNPREATLFLTFASEICDSFRGTYKRSFDWDLYLKLGSPLARRLYRFLEKRFFRQSNLQFPLAHFSQEKVGLSRNYPTRKYKYQLLPAVAELALVGVLRPDPPADMFRKIAGQTIARFRAGYASSSLEQRKKRTSPRPKPSYLLPNGPSSSAPTTDRTTTGASHSRMAPLTPQQRKLHLERALDCGPHNLKDGYFRTSQNGGTAHTHYAKLLVSWAIESEEQKS